MRPSCIVQIVADDMGYGDLSCVNGKASNTPILDGLVDAGLSLSQHYSASPVCAPARAGLLTGRYPQRVGVIDTLETRGLDRLALGEKTMADVLSSHGWATGLVGKWHCGAIGGGYHPQSRGFAEFFGFRGGWQDYWDWNLEVGSSVLRADGRYLTDVFTDAAVDFIRRHRHEPFYLHLAYNAPHFPWQAPDAVTAPFRERGLSEGVALVYAMLEVMDAGIGRVLTALEDAGLSDSALVMFCSDNGPQLSGYDLDLRRFNGGLRGEKGAVFEGGIRVPAILRWPDGLPSAQTSTALMHFTDWAPTLLSGAGVNFDQRITDGAVRLAQLRGESRAEERPRFWQWSRYAPDPRSNVAVRDGRWKLVIPPRQGSLDVSPQDATDDEAHAAMPWTFTTIRTSTPDRPDLGPVQAPLLFDLWTDPFEQQDVAHHEPRVVGRLLSAIDGWYDEVFSRPTQG